ncbi:MAG: hypothetical protein PHE56_00835 [Bacteroidales bacterium]|nr:hypothetical protein [Bacteroidales bacterium]
MKKSISVLMSVIVMTVLVAACGGNEKKSSEKQTPEEMLKGKWEIVEATGDFAELNVGTVYSFGEDGAFSTSAGILESKGKVTSLDDKVFKVKFDGMESEFVYNYKFDGEKLIIEIESSNQKFTLEKK